MNPNEEKFNREIRNYSEPRDREFEKWFMSLMNKQNKNSKIIDLGCGNGNILRILKNLGFKNIIGIDASTNLLKRAGKITKVKQCDLEKKLPLKNESFDIAIAKDICEHLLNIEQFIGETHRILKPDGMLIIAGPNLKSIYHRLRILFGKTHHVSINFGLIHLRWVSHDLFEKWLNPYFNYKPVVFEIFAKIKPNLLAKTCNYICCKK